VVALYIGGEKVGTLADAVRLIPESISRNTPVEFRDDAGAVVGKFVPTPTRPLKADDPFAWVTEEEIAKRMAEPAVPFEEVRKRLGWE
jgi:hypothetical protein